MSLPISNSLNEDLSQYAVYVFIYADCQDVDKPREEVILEVLADGGTTWRAQVTNALHFSQKHGYRKGEIYEIPKGQVHSHTRSLRRSTQLNDQRG